MNAEIQVTLRLHARAAEVRGVDTLAFMREDYRARLVEMVDRGYGDAASLNAEAAQWATGCFGPCPTDTLGRAAWYTLGLNLVQAEHEHNDPNLD